jgi:DNA-binding transcriptional LysR family regulator
VHIRGLDLNLLVVLDAILTEGGITKAARKLNLTQPAISHALGRLREVFGDPLLVREGRGMRATPLARNLAEPVRRALRGLEVTLTEIESFDAATTQRRFTIGVRDVLESTLLPPLMRAIHRAAPQVDVAALMVGRAELESELASGRIDAALDVRWPMSEAVRRQRIAEEQLVVIARRRHPFVKKGLDLAGYLAQEHVFVSSRRSGPGPLDLELVRLGHQRRIRLRCQHYFAACRVVSVTNLILTMPEHYARIVNRQLPNQILPLPIAMPPLDAYLYWHADVDRDPANRWLREQLVSVFRPRVAGSLVEGADSPA